MDLENFEKLVQDAIKELPSFVREKMDNIAVCVEENPSTINQENSRVRKNSFLLGLYQGVPKNTWGRGFGGNLPDKITIFKEPIERYAKNRKNIKEVVKETVYHEIAHHFGFNEKEVRNLEKSSNEKNRNN